MPVHDPPFSQLLCSVRSHQWATRRWHRRRRGNDAPYTIWVSPRLNRKQFWLFQYSASLKYFALKMAGTGKHIPKPLGPDTSAPITSAPWTTERSSWRVRSRLCARALRPQTWMFALIPPSDLSHGFASAVTAAHSVCHTCFRLVVPHIAAAGSSVASSAGCLGAEDTSPVSTQYDAASPASSTTLSCDTYGHLPNMFLGGNLNEQRQRPLILLLQLGWLHVSRTASSNHFLRLPEKKDGQQKPFATSA